MPARSIDTATISFGLVSIPVKVYSSSEPSHEVHFHLLHAGCGERLKQKYMCPEHGEVERADMTKGFELSKGSYVELSKEELDALDAVASRTVDVRELVPASAVDPIYVERTYYLAPDRGAARAYRLLHDALVDTDLVAIASYAARGNSYVVMVRPYEDGFAMHQLRYEDEIKPWSEVPLDTLPKPTAAELHLARQVIDSLTHKTFDPTKYKDEVKARVRELVADKAKGGEIIAPELAEAPPVTDLMAALKASLGQASAHRSEPARRGRAAAARSHRAPRQPAARPRPHGRRRASSSRARA